MSERFGHGVMVTLLLVGGCGGSGVSSNHGGIATGSAGWAGGAGGSAGGEPATGGAIGSGATGSAGDGAYGTGAAGGASAGTGDDGYGGATSSAGAGGGGGATDGGGVAGTDWLTPPPVPPALEPPAGATVKLHAHAVGAQIYTCAATSGGADAGAPTYAWVLRAPDAKLYDASGTQVGTHGAGPSWTWRDGSVANGLKVVELAAPTTDAISWLLLRVTSTSGAGALSDATYVQRLATVGGKAPSTGCDATTVGSETRAGYSADYYFYTGGGAAAWLTPPVVPSDIAAPTDVRLALHDRGIGMQIYACLATGDAGAPTYSWVFRSPDALLFDMSWTPVASHGAGPSWTSTDGSVVEAREIARVDAPRAGAIPWLLLKELSTTGPGVFAEIAFVQRVNTAGGVAPTSGCDASNVNTLARVPYAADYYFYVSIDQRDGGTGD